MKTASELLNHQIEIMHKKNWDTIYIAIDWHDTMMPSNNYSLDYGDYKLYDYADEVLKWMSDCVNIRLILYSSSHIEQRADLIYNLYSRYGISFDYHNGNPEIKNTVTGDFSEKFYFSVLLDDKSGFDPLTDWKELYDNIELANRKFKNVQ